MEGEYVGSFLFPSQIVVPLKFPGFISSIFEPGNEEFSITVQYKTKDVCLVVIFIHNWN